MPDFELIDHGDSFQLVPLTARAFAWVNEHAQLDTHGQPAPISARQYETVTRGLLEQGYAYRYRMH